MSPVEASEWTWPMLPAGPGSRLMQIVKWFGQDYDGAIVFDECHRCDSSSIKPAHQVLSSPDPRSPAP